MREVATVLVADITSGAYEITKLAHILAAIAGFGLTFWLGVYGMRAQKLGQAGDAMGAAAIAEANHAASSIMKYVIYSVPVLGVGLIFMSDDFWEFSQTWITLSFVLFAVALTLALAIIQPAGKEIARVSRELASMGGPPPGATGPPPQVAQLDALGKKIGMFSGINHLLVVAILYLMVAKPGL